MNDAALREFIDGAAARQLAPSLVVGVVDADRERFVHAAGLRDVAHSSPLAPDAIFRIASMTKPVTSLAAMMLAEDGAIGIEEPAARYLPELEGLRVLTAFDEATGRWESRPPARAVTVRHLLTHTSGIAYSFLDPRLAKIDDGKKSRVEMPLLHDPGERFSYGPGTAVLGSILAAASGRTLDDFCRERIFEPLGMIDTGYAVPAGKRNRVVTQHARARDGAFAEQPNAATIASRGRGDDGLLSTARDYGRFMQLFLNRGRSSGAHVVSEDTIRAMTSNQIGALRIGSQPAAPGAIARAFPIGGEKDGFGFGFQIETPPLESRTGLRSAGTCSWSSIFNTYFWIDLQRQRGVVVLMQYLPALDAGAVEILEGVERLVYEQRN